MRKKKKRKVSLKLIKVFGYLITLIIIFKISINYEINNNYIEGKINLIIDNNIITNELEHDLFVNDKNVIYMSKEDIGKYFDAGIKYDDKNNQLITSFGEKTVELPLNQNIMKVNEREVDVLSGAIQKDGIYYLPITSMEKIYELDIEYVKEEKILLLDSLTKKLINADISKKCNLKQKPTAFSRKIEKLQRGDKVVVIEKVDKGWTKIRTQNGIIGYVKTKILQNELYVREDFMIEM